MRFSYFLFFLIGSLSFSSFADQYFYCDFKGPPHNQYHSDSSYFDTTLHIRPEKGQAYFQNYSGESKIQEKYENGIFSRVYYDSQRGEGPDYREVYTIHRFNSHTNEMIRSYVYYSSLEYYENWETIKKNPNVVKHNGKVLDFIDKPVKEGEIRFGWDKSLWVCSPVSKFKYLLYSFGLGLGQLLGA